MLYNVVFITTLYSVCVASIKPNARTAQNAKNMSMNMPDRYKLNGLSGVYKMNVYLYLVAKIDNS